MRFTALGDMLAIRLDSSGPWREGGYDASFVVSLDGFYLVSPPLMRRWKKLKTTKYKI